MPLEQSTIFMIVGRLRVAGEFPMAVTYKLKNRVYSIFVGIYTVSVLTMIAPEPTIEYDERPQSGLLKVKGDIGKSVVGLTE